MEALGEGVEGSEGRTKGRLIRDRTLGRGLGGGGGGGSDDTSLKETVLLGSGRRGAFTGLGTDFEGRKGEEVEG